MVLTRTRTNRKKKAVLVSVWLRNESLLKEYYNTNKLNNIIIII